MPYLPVDLDAKRRAEAIERALGLIRFSIIGGLLEVWETVWREKSAVVDELTICAAFGADERVRIALESRGFLEQVDTTGWRVCGAEKWLFGMEGRSRGGHAASGNLIPGARQKKQAAEKTQQPEPEFLGSSREPAESQPTPPLGSFSALTPSTQHPNIKKTKALSAEADRSEPFAKQSWEVFEHWRAKMRKNARTVFDARRRGAVERALKAGYSVEDLKQAVDGCAVTPHNQGHNDRGERYDDLELICRDAAHVDRFMRNAKSPPKRRATSGRASEADKNWDDVPAGNDSDEVFEVAI